MGWDCNSDCWNELKHCLRGPWERTCFPPEPTSYAACNAAKAASCTADAANLEVIHGNYCGKGQKGKNYSLPPADLLDSACQAHDQCYDSRGAHSCSCDRELLALANNIGTGIHGAGNMQEQGKLVAGLFSVAPCVPR